ncbi:hypothetical protein Tco_0817553 [Tanacetum coccineum]
MVDRLEGGNHDYDILKRSFVGGTKKSGKNINVVGIHKKNYDKSVMDVDTFKVYASAVASKNSGEANISCTTLLALLNMLYVYGLLLICLLVINTLIVNHSYLFMEDESIMQPKTCLFKGGSDIGYGTNSMLEQWRETKRDDDYDTYDDDMYENHDMFHHLQAVCDDLDIMVHGLHSSDAGDDVLLAVVQHMAPLSLETEVKGSILTHSQGQRSISSFGRTGSSFPTSLRLVGVGLSTSQPPSYTVKDGIRAQNP